MKTKPCWLYLGFSFALAIFSWPCVLLHNLLYDVRYGYGLHPVWVLNIRDITFLIPTAAAVYFALFIASGLRRDLSSNGVVALASMGVVGVIIFYCLALMYGLWMVSMGG